MLKHKMVRCKMQIINECIRCPVKKPDRLTTFRRFWLTILYYGNQSNEMVGMFQRRPVKDVIFPILAMNSTLFEMPLKLCFSQIYDKIRESQAARMLNLTLHLRFKKQAINLASWQLEIRERDWTMDKAKGL
jgi:hypothetical protein